MGRDKYKFLPASSGKRPGAALVGPLVKCAVQCSCSFRVVHRTFQVLTNHVDILVDCCILYTARLHTCVHTTYQLGNSVQVPSIPSIPSTLTLERQVCLAMPTADTLFRLISLFLPPPTTAAHVACLCAASGICTYASFYIAYTLYCL